MGKFWSALNGIWLELAGEHPGQFAKFYHTDHPEVSVLRIENPFGVVVAELQLSSYTKGMLSDALISGTYANDTVLPITQKSKQLGSVSIVVTKSACTTVEIVNHLNERFRFFADYGRMRYGESLRGSTGTFTDALKNLLSMCSEASEMYTGLNSEYHDIFLDFAETSGVVDFALWEISVKSILENFPKTVQDTLYADEVERILLDDTKISANPSHVRYMLLATGPQSFCPVIDLWGISNNKEEISKRLYPVFARIAETFRVPLK